jgi:hypothetical protein
MTSKEIIDVLTFVISLGKVLELISLKRTGTRTLESNVEKKLACSDLALLSF